MTRRLGVLFIGALFAAACVAAASAPADGQAAQTPPAETKPGEAKPEEEKKEEKPKTLWEKNTLSAYLETSLVWNRGGRAAATTNGGQDLPSGLGLVGRRGPLPGDDVQLLGQERPGEFLREGAW